VFHTPEGFKQKFYDMRYRSRIYFDACLKMSYIDMAISRKFLTLETITIYSQYTILLVKHALNQVIVKFSGSKRSACWWNLRRTKRYNYYGTLNYLVLLCWWAGNDLVLIKIKMIKLQSKLFLIIFPNGILCILGLLIPENCLSIWR